MPGHIGIVNQVGRDRGSGISMGIEGIGEAGIGVPVRYPVSGVRETECEERRPEAGYRSPVPDP